MKILNHAHVLKAGFDYTANLYCESVEIFGLTFGVVYGRMIMRNLIVFIALIVGNFFCATCNADLTLNISFQLAHVSGPDTLGLNGANVSFDAVFANGVVYTNVFGFPATAATSHSLTISGASNLASNGTFADPDGFLYAPVGSEGLFIDNATNYFFYRTPTIASGLSFKFGLSLGPPPIQPSVADFVNPTDFSTILNPSPTSQLEAVTNDTAIPTTVYTIAAGSDSTSYTGSSDPNAVPEPGSLLVLSALCLGLVSTRRRRLR